MTNITSLPPPSKPLAPAAAEAALSQARCLALRIMGAAMLPTSLPAMSDALMLQLAHRLGTIQAMAEALIAQLGTTLQQPQPGEKTNA